MGNSLHFILNTISNETYSYCQVKIPKLYKHVTAWIYGLNRLDGTMTDLQNIHQASLSSSQCIFWRPVIMQSNLHLHYSIETNKKLENKLNNYIYIYIFNTKPCWIKYTLFCYPLKANFKYVSILHYISWTQLINFYLILYFIL